MLWLVGIGCLFLPVFGDPPLRSGAYVQRVVGDRAVVAMITPEPRSLSLELRGEEGDRRWSSPSRRRHVFELDGLRADSRYGFSVLDEAGKELDRGSFRSAPDRDNAVVKFAVVGDSGGLPFWTFLKRSALLQLPARWGWLPVRVNLGRTASRMAEQSPDFWLHVGDVVYSAGENRHYEAAFFRPFAELLRHSPVYAVLGNHDKMNDDGRQLMANLVLPENSLTGDERFFSFAYGSVRVIGLDLDGNVEADHPALSFLRQELPRVSEPWLVVLSHFPFYSASRQGDREDLQEHLLPLLRQHQVDLYLAGHDHNYQRFTGDVVQVISGGGGKSLYVLEEHELLAKAVGEYHFCTVEVSGSELTLQAIGNESGVMDELRLDKAKWPDRLEALREVNPQRHGRIKALLR